MDTKKFTEKLKSHIKFSGYTQKRLAEELGITQPQVNNIVSGRERLGLKNAERFANALSLDPVWLMTQGEHGTPPDGDTPTTAIAKADPDTINVPVLNLDVRGGLAYNDVTDMDEYKVGVMPFSRQIATEGDVVVPVYGESMTPRYPNGSHILIRPLPRWREWLELGNAYVLELADWRRTIKIVRRGTTPDSYRLECYNVDFDTTEIPKSLIEHIWQVLACVKREVM